MTHCEPNTRDRYLLFVSQQKRSFRTARATSTRCNLSNARRMLQGRITRPQLLSGRPSTSFAMRCRPATAMTTPMKLPVGHDALTLGGHAGGKGHVNIDQANVPTANASLYCGGEAHHKEKQHEYASEKHDMPLVRRRGRNRGADLCEHLSRFIVWRVAPCAGSLSVREKRRCFDGRVHGDGQSLPRAQWRTGVQAQRSILVSGRNR